MLQILCRCKKIGCSTKAKSWADEKQGKFVWSGACDYVENTYLLSAVGLAMNRNQLSFTSQGLIANDCFVILSGIIVVLYPLLISLWMYHVWTFDVKKIKADIDSDEAYVDNVYTEDIPDYVESQIQNVIRHQDIVPVKRP